jgi:transposase
VSICVLAERYGVKGQTLRKQYKEKISDYRNWDQLEHAHDYLLYPENIGENLSLDETCLSNGDVYTILTNKAAKGRKGALVAMVRGVATDAVSGILRRLPHRKRLSVKTVTTDLSSAMMLTVRKVFPAAKLINDRFHVQQLMSEAVDQLRIRYRWKVLDAENQAIREHRQKKKEAKSKAERERIGKWEPERMENGETLPQIVSRSKHIILKHWSKWNEQLQIGVVCKPSIVKRRFDSVIQSVVIQTSLRQELITVKEIFHATVENITVYHRMELLGNNGF